MVLSRGEWPLTTSQELSHAKKYLEQHQLSFRRRQEELLSVRLELATDSNHKVIMLHDIVPTFGLLQLLSVHCGCGNNISAVECTLWLW